jgi:RNA polymerase sigma-70 factor (sigma-E family)
MGAELSVTLADSDERVISADDSFNDLYDAFYQRLVRLALALLGDPVVAEDVVQEAFARLLTARSVRNPGAYLSTTVVNLVRSRGRRVAVIRRHPVELPLPADPADATSDRVGLRAEVLAALSRLPTRQREAVVLRFYRGLSDQEVADAMGISLGSVKRHLHRAVPALARDLEAFR